MSVYLQKLQSGKNRKWRAFVRVKGFPAQTKVFRLKSEAKEWAEQEEANLKAGKYVPSSSRTVDELIQKYRDDVLAFRKNNGGNQRFLLNWWSDKIGNLKVQEVTPQLLDAMRNRLRRSKNKAGRIHSPANVNRYFSLISAVFRSAVLWGWIRENPMRDITKIPETPGRTRFLSREECRDLLDACKKSRQPLLYEIVLLTLSTGGRRGEIMSLMWEDVDFENRFITFRQTKNGEDRNVPLSSEMFALLEARRKPKGKLYPSNGSRYPSRDKQYFCVRHAFSTVCKKVGLENFRFHDLRHTAASYLAMSGASLLDIAEILGHKSLSMTRRYAHLTQSHLHEAVERLSQAIPRMDEVSNREEISLES
jgi:integrase